MPTVVDAHQHFWQHSLPFDYSWQDGPEMKPIRRDFLPADLVPHLKATGVDYSVFVQTQHDVAENRWVLGLASEYDFIAGVVGWVDLASEAVADQLAEFQSHPKFVGIRHAVQGEPDDDFIVRPEILRGLKALEQAGMPYDLLFYDKHLKHATTVAAEVPTLPLVIDHLSKPQIRAGEIKTWERELRAAAEHQNVHCKLSGMVTEADWEHWTVDDLKPYFDVILDAFGPERLLFGSDWPVCELAATYEEVHAAAVELTASLSESERHAIFGGNAIRFYHLPIEMGK